MTTAAHMSPLDMPHQCRAYAIKRAWEFGVQAERIALEEPDKGMDAIVTIAQLGATWAQIALAMKELES